MSYSTQISRAVYWLAPVLLLLCLSTAQTEHPLDPQIRVGINLFPAFLAARTAPAHRPDHAAVVFTTMDREVQQIAELLAKRLQKSTPRAQFTLTHIDALAEIHAHEPLTALFVAQHLGDAEIQQLVRFAETAHMISFSPFADDVERGILGGIAVTDKILPEINLHTLRRSGISLKPFFFQIARHYGPGVAE